MKRITLITALVIVMAAAAIPASAQSSGLPKLLDTRSAAVERLVYDSALHGSLERMALKEAWKYLPPVLGPEIPQPWPDPPQPDPRVHVTDFGSYTVVEFLEPGKVFIRCTVSNADGTPITDGDEITLRVSIAYLEARF